MSQEPARTTANDRLGAKNSAGGRRVRLPIRRKLLAAFMAAIALPLLVIAVYVRIWTERSLESRALNDVAVACEQAARAVESALAGARGDVTLLSRSPEVMALAESAMRGDGELMEASRERVEGLFLALSETKLVYNQVRFIDLSGREVVRVDSNRRRAWVVPHEELQDKSQRYYFQKTVALEPGHVYVSPLDLNRERGEIERPYRPVIRYATPVFVGEESAGIVVTNMFGNVFLDPIRDYGSEETGVQALVDQDGFYLGHSQRKKEWGGPNDLDTGEGLRRDYGEAAETVLRREAGTIDIEQCVASYRRIRPCLWDEHRYWVLMQEVPKRVALAPVRTFRLALGTVFAISLLGALALSVYLSRRLSDPLREVERGAQLIGNGELSHRVVVDTGDEVEALAESFNQMASRLAEVRAQEQLALLGRMAAGVVHDIRNPLTSIKGFADLLVSTDDREERREFGEIVQEDTDRILSMVQELLDFSRGGTADLRLKTVSLRGFLERVADTLRRDMERVGVAVELGPIDDAPVNLDVSRMTRMILNIASNAREAMQREGGVFTIEAHRLDGTVRIALQDTGPGIPEEVAYTLFEPFVTSGKENGTGLGLAICKQIVEAHGGTISFDDSAPRGARFVVELPVATGEMPRAVE